MPGGLFCAISNPLSDGEWTYTWQNGRQLKKTQKSGETVEFVYNENGLRVQKTATSTGVTKYTLHGKNIVHMTQGSNELHFFYDAQNNPAVVVYNGIPYSYVKNQQGDIVAILDSTKNVVVSFVYDAWGRPISKTGSLASTLGTVQPFRYRGYVYDEETGLYYLRSRYYNCFLCRFINADSLIDCTSSISRKSSYCYCSNNPIICIDPDGFIWLSKYHDAVRDAVQNQLGGQAAGVYTEVGFFKWEDSEQIGRADVIDVNSGEIWEVKPHMASFYRDPEGFFWDTQMQLLSYIFGAVRSDRWKKKIFARKFKKGRSLSGTTIVDDQIVKYWCERNNGIVWYTIIDPPDDKGSRKRRSDGEIDNETMLMTSAVVVGGSAILSMANMICAIDFTDQIFMCDLAWK